MRMRRDFITNSSSSSYIISVKDNELTKSERAILDFILSVEDEPDSEEAEMLKKLPESNETIYQKYIDYSSGLEEILDKFPKDKVTYFEGYEIEDRCFY